MTSAEELTLRINGDSAGGQAAIGALEGSLHGLVGTIAGGVAAGNLLTEALNAVLSVVKDSLEAVPKMVEHVTQLGNQLYEMSLKTGASVENLSALRYVASQTGFDFDRLGTTFFMMEKNLGATGAAGDKVREVIHGLGLDFATLRQESPDRQFIDVVAALGNVSDRAVQAHDAMILFGRGARDMMGLFHEDVKQLIQEATDLGLIMDTKTAAAAHAAEIGMKAFGLQVEAVENQIGATFLPVLITLSKLASEAFHTVMAGSEGLSTVLSDRRGEQGMVRLGEAIIQATAMLGGFVQGASTGLNLVLQHALRVGQAFINIADVSLKMATLGTVDEKGQTILDHVAKGLHDSYDALQSLKAPIQGGTEFLGGLGAKVEQVADSMSGHFREAWQRTSDAIAHFSQLSRAGAGAASELGDGITAVGTALDKFNLNQGQLLFGTPGGRATSAFHAGLIDFNDALPTNSLRTSGLVAGGQRDDAFGASAILTAIRPTLTDGFGTLFSKDVPTAVIRAIEGGGDVWKASSTVIGQKFGQNLSEKIGSSLVDKGGTLGNLFSDPKSLLGGLMSGGLSTAIGAGMSLLTKGLGALMHFGGPSKAELAARDSQAQMIDQLKGLATQGEITAGALTDNYHTIAIVARDAYLATGSSADDAARHVAALLDTHNPEAYKAAMADLNATLSIQKQDDADLNAAIKEYGFSLDQLGPTLKKQQLDTEAAKIENQFRLLAGSGIDVALIESKMSGNINQYLADVIKTGQQVPIAMRPMLEQMAKQGELTDAAGNKITDLDKAGITWAETMSSAADRIVKGFQDVLEKIGLIPKALNSLPTDLTINVHGNYIPPDFGGAMAAGGAFHVTTPTMFLAGERPGGEDVWFSGAGKRFGGSDSAAVVAGLDRMQQSLDDLPDAFGRKVRDALQMAG